MVDYKNLEQKAIELRRKIIDIAYERKQGHIGGALSIVEILTSLFYHHMNGDDKFILSKGHGWLPYFVILKEKGYNPKLSGHPEIDKENGIECTTGSLGHGLPIGLGMALARKIQKKLGKIYVVMSDGECQEGTTWESLLIGAHHKLDNVVVIVDDNNLQTLGKTSEILSVGNIEEVVKSLNWDVSRINGHSFEEIINALDKPSNGKPRIIIADTVKGKGVSYMENVSMWHTCIPNEEQYKQAMEELK